MSKVNNESKTKRIANGKEVSSSDLLYLGEKHAQNT